MASGDTKTNQYLDIAARGTRADLQRGCCNTRTQDLIMDVAERIITEEETRYREDQILQSEIDEIKNNPDVYDIVATYADLQNYDTSTITDKDIIRVLRDETHDNASTYYRWDATDQEFDYVGETGDYYTKAQVNALLALKADKATTYTKTETDALLDGKQDVLTAGENITISEESGALVISATDTTYSDFTGTDGTTAGTAGLVPAPTTTDGDKYLKGDGTWETVQAGPTVVQTAGTSTTDVMSQNAVTSMVYADPATRYKVRITNDQSAIENNAIAIGRSATNVWENSIGIGYSASASSKEGVALGHSARISNALGGIALGAYSRANSQGEMNIGSTNTSYGYNSSNYRLLSGLYDPQSAHDAATKGYCDNAIINGGTTAPTTATVGAVGTQYTYVDTTGTHTAHLCVCTEIDTTDPSTPVYTWQTLI